MKAEPRTKVITFRLSESDYDALKLACRIDQSSVSAVARRSVLAWAESPSRRPGLERRLAEIADSLETLCALLTKHGAN